MEATIDGELAGVCNEIISPKRAGNAASGTKNFEQNNAVRKAEKRGRPKGSRTTTLAAVRKQAAEEKNQLKRELDKKIRDLRSELQTLQGKYDQDIAQLQDELEVFRRREASYRLALSERLNEVADHLQTTLLNWGSAELEEAQIDKRGRGRPRKTLKPV
ncbi:MAG: DNA-binding protein [Thiolinea sp.]